VGNPTVTIDFTPWVAAYGYPATLAVAPPS
jgi:hypothetical protein